MGRKLHKSKRGSIVSFHDVSYEVDVRKLPCSCPNRVTVLSHLSGILTPGMNAIMGPTGCGKSSFLDVLAGRKNPKNVSGYVLLDGERQPVQVHRQVSGYVVQDNIAVNTLTVRENIAFSAALRLSRHVTPKERKAKVAGVIEELGLSAVADRLLGTEYVRGVSGGERKRTCIGIELIKDPLVLYLDEPTTGLDAYTAGSVMKTLRRMALAGRTIVFSIHQPKYSIYRLFDRITLIANGQMIYHGPAGRDPIEYFGRFGYVLEGYNNPADFLMDTLHGEVPITETSVEIGEENEDPEVYMLLPCQSSLQYDDTPGSLRTTVIQRLINCWKQSELFESCQQTVNMIARAYEARHVRSRSPSPSGACSSNQVHSYHWSPSTPRSGDHLLLGECRVQSAPVCRLLPNRLNIHGIPVRTTKQLGLCGLDTSLRQLTMRTASYSDAKALSSHDRSLLGNQSSGFQPHPCSSERLLGEPIELSSRVEDSEGQLISDNSSKPDFRFDRERSHFFPFYQACSDQPLPRLCLSRQSGPSQSIVIRSLLNQPNPAYTRIESGSQSPPCEGRHSVTSSVSIYDPIENITNVASHLSDSGAGSRGSVMAPASFRAVRHPVARSWSQSQSPRMCLTPSRTRIRQKRPGRAILCADSPYAASYCQQLFALIGRQCLSMLRDYKSLMSHFIIQFIIALFLGIIYYDLDQSLESGIQNRTGLFFFTCVQLLFINSSMIDTFLRDRVIFKHETSAGFYRVSAYFFSKIIAEVLPTKALPAMLFLPITYLMAGLRSSLRAFLFWELTLTLLTITASGISFSVSAMVTDFRVGSMLLSMFFVLMMITSGFLINVLSLSFWLSWVRYLSILRFAINTLIINEISGMLFCPLNTDLYPNSNGSSGLSTGITNVTSRYEFPLRQSHVSAHAFATSELALSGNCITGEQYMETQAIEFDSEWTVWLNECGIFVIFILALINAYVYLRLMKKYK